MLVESFSILNIVERERYSRGISDSNPGCQGPYSAESDSMVIADVFEWKPVSCSAVPCHPLGGQVSLILSSDSLVTPPLGHTEKNSVRAMFSVSPRTWTLLDMTSKLTTDQSSAKTAANSCSFMGAKS